MKKIFGLAFILTASLLADLTIDMAMATPPSAVTSSVRAPTASKSQACSLRLASCQTALEESKSQIADLTESLNVVEESQLTCQSDLGDIDAQLVTISDELLNCKADKQAFEQLNDTLAAENADLKEQIANLKIIKQPLNDIVPCIRKLSRASLLHSGKPSLSSKIKKLSKACRAKAHENNSILTSFGIVLTK